MHLDDFRQSHWYAQLLKTSGWKVIHLDDTKASCLYLWKIPYTPFTYLIAQRINPPVPFQKISQVAIENYSIYIHIETNTRQKIKPPDDYVISKFPTTPRKTLVLNLYTTTHAQFDVLTAKAKYNIRYAEKHKTEIHYLNSDLHLNQDLINDIYRLLAQTAEKKQFTQISKEWLLDLLKYGGSHVHIIYAVLKQQMIATAVFISTKNTLFYIYSGSNADGKKSRINSLIVWEGIKLAIKLKLKYFDLEGIYDSRNSELTDAWQGFTTFKKSFSQNIVTYPEAICQVRRNFRYSLVSWLVKPQTLPLIYPYIL